MSGANPVVLFDGVCNLCNGSVNFLLDRDHRETFRFASLQSDAGQRLLAEHGLPADDFDSFVLVEEGRAYTRSTAALRVARRLGFPWRLASLLLVIPAFLRDPFYDLVAKNRYRWFGKEETCRVPTPELRARFLPDEA